ncbi:MAG: hypothetical protein EXS18_05615 [Verrucomicrobiae bacterium]|nr:hypothetical protein [Verrucomicrobiae bacterium]
MAKSEEVRQRHLCICHQVQLEDRDGHLSIVSLAAEMMVAASVTLETLQFRPLADFSRAEKN